MLSSAACIAAASAEPIIPGYDLIKASASYTGGMHFDDSGNEMQLWQYNVRTIVSPPLYATENFVILPVVDYKATLMDLGNGFDDDLHSFALSTFLVHTRKDSPWMFGAWLRAEYASDLDQSTSDAFSFDVIAGAAYKFSDSLTIGFGGAAVNLSNDEDFYVGPALEWKINECYRVALFGPNGGLYFKPNENWEFSLAGEASGDEWVVGGGSVTSTNAIVDLDVYRIGLFADHRLTGDLWLRVGGGVTVANSLEIKNMEGNRAFKDDLDEGWFGEIALRLDIW
ncbi:MAG TPA: hypothetical protein VM511_02190 [Luteolibacter sp.]|nr:hypothetical protein [Luteolibacter sp.]